MRPNPDEVQAGRSHEIIEHHRRNHRDAMTSFAKQPPEPAGRQDPVRRANGPARTMARSRPSRRKARKPRRFAPNYEGQNQNYERMAKQHFSFRVSLLLALLRPFLIVSQFGA